MDEKSALNRQNLILKEKEIYINRLEKELAKCQEIIRENKTNINECSTANQQGEDKIKKFEGMNNGDGLLIGNFRSDRVRQIISTLIDRDFMRSN